MAKGIYCEPPSAACQALKGYKGAKGAACCKSDCRSALKSTAPCGPSQLSWAGFLGWLLSGSGNKNSSIRRFLFVMCKVYVQTMKWSTLPY